MSLIYLIEEEFGKQKDKETITTYTKRVLNEVEEKYGKKRVRLELNKIYRIALGYSRINRIFNTSMGYESTILLAIQKLLKQFKKNDEKQV